MPMRGVSVKASMGDLEGAFYIGAQYQDIDERRNGSVNFPIMGQSVPVGYDVVSEAEDEWNFLLGVNLKTGGNWNYGLEAGFSERKHLMATLNYRF